MNSWDREFRICEYFSFVNSDPTVVLIFEKELDSDISPVFWLFGAFLDSSIKLERSTAPMGLIASGVFANSSSLHSFLNSSMVYIIPLTTKSLEKLIKICASCFPISSNMSKYG